MKYLKNVTTLNLLSDKCAGCKICMDVCPHDVFDIFDGKAVIKDKNRCMECGACANNCPAQAITVDAGTGCAAAIIFGWLTGSEPACGCGEGECC